MLASRIRMATFKDSLFIPEGYVLATDDDFSGTSNGNFRYIGTDEYVEIPHVIKGVPITSYSSMFRDTSVKGVKSTNKNVTNMNSMFRGSQATSLDLSSFDTSSVTNMNSMFRESRATTLDLSSFNTSNVTNMYAMFAASSTKTLDLSSFDISNDTDLRYMFGGSSATTGYARTQADADKFNESDNRPAGLNFVVKP